MQKSDKSKIRKKTTYSGKKIYIIIENTYLLINLFFFFLKQNKIIIKINIIKYYIHIKFVCIHMTNSIYLDLL